MDKIELPLTLSVNAFASLPHFSTTVLLVDDQPIVAEALKRQLEGQQDITFLYCSDSLQAEAFALANKPTVILLDLVMPNLDGLALLKNYRMNSHTKDIPIIVLSIEENPQIKAEAFALGANDYVVKIPDKLELLARIRYHSMSYIRLLERNVAYLKLEENQKILQKELADAAAYVISLFPQPISQPFKVDWRFIPSMQLGGDAFGYHWLDKRNFAIYLLDVCGHGVGAALHSISVVNTLRSGNLSHADFYHPSSVLKELNAIFQMEDHHDMFLTIWYGVFDIENRRLIFSNGGHPPALRIRKNENRTLTFSELTTHNIAIGVTSDAQFDEQEVILDLGDELLIFSDGVFEIPKEDGLMMSFSDFLKLLSSLSLTESENDLLDSLINETRKIQNNDNYVDDFSIVQLRL